MVTLAFNASVSSLSVVGQYVAVVVEGRSVALYDGHSVSRVGEVQVPQRIRAVVGGPEGSLVVATGQGLFTYGQTLAKLNIPAEDIR